MSVLSRALPLFVAASFVAAAPQPASACGGTFCDGVVATQSMPVDQTGENILFVLGDGFVEAHIQIQYTGDPEKFAWIVPVLVEPDVEIGSDPLFSALLTSTVPTFDAVTQSDGCGGGPALGCGGDLSADGAGGGDTGGEPPGTPEVVKSGVAGAFEYSVLDGGTVQGVVDWLEANDYAQDDDAPPILQEYLDADFMFVAFKLTAGAGIDEIHPVVLRYEGTEPCVPIRLTRIAARDDMGIRTFFLSDTRVAPTNYREVQINPLRVDWINLGSNYEQVVSEAVDSAGADGHAFVTEFAGSNEIIEREFVLDPRWDATRFETALPGNALEELKLQGLISCDEFTRTCGLATPVLKALLDEYLPTPVGVSDDDFWSDPSDYVTGIDLDAWRPMSFMAELEERVIGPAENAVDLLEEHAYLTRLFTTMSPHEMTVDPMFHRAPDLPDVSNRFSATIWRVCDGVDYVELDDGRRIALTEDGAQPAQGDAALRVAEIGPSGAPVVIADNREDIDEELREWNAERGLDSESCNCRANRFDLHGPLLFSALFGFLWFRRRRSSY